MYLRIVSLGSHYRSGMQPTYTEQRGRNCKADQEVKTGSTPKQHVGYRKHLLSVIGIGGEVVNANGNGKYCCGKLPRVSLVDQCVETSLPTKQTQPIAENRVEGVRDPRSSSEYNRPLMQYRINTSKAVPECCADGTDHVKGSATAQI